MWDLELEAADILIVEEHYARKIIAGYPGKTFVVLQGNAAAALMTCRDEGCALEKSKFILEKRRTSKNYGNEVSKI